MLFGPARGGRWTCTEELYKWAVSTSTLRTLRVYDSAFILSMKPILLVPVNFVLTESLSINILIKLGY